MQRYVLDKADDIIDAPPNQCAAEVAARACSPEDSRPPLLDVAYAPLVRLALCPPHGQAGDGGYKAWRVLRPAMARWRGAGIRHLADIMREYGRSTERDYRKFASVGGEFANGTTWKRLGYLAEVLWPEEKTLAEQARKHLTAGTVKLDPRASRRGTLLRRWGLWINAAISNEAYNPAPLTSTPASCPHLLSYPLGEKALEQGLVRNIALVGEQFQARDQRNRQTQRNRT